MLDDRCNLGCVNRRIEVTGENHRLGRRAEKFDERLVLFAAIIRTGGVVQVRADEGYSLAGFLTGLKSRECDALFALTIGR